MSVSWKLRWTGLALLGGWLLLAGRGQAAEPVGGLAVGRLLLQEDFNGAATGWLRDNFSRVVDGGYLIDTSGRGGFYRWLNEPADLTDFVYQVELRKLRGDDLKPKYGQIFRVQSAAADGWRNCYFFVINGAGGWVFGKFVEGSPITLRDGSRPEVINGGEASNLLTVTAQGGRFTLRANGQVLATVQDDTFLRGGRIGVMAEVPALVRFDDLRVWAPPAVSPPTGPAVVTAPGSAPVLFRDTFDTNRGWAIDEVRSLRDGAYHMEKPPGEGGNHRAWLPATETLTDFVATMDVQLVEGGPKVLLGMLWHVVDRGHFYFFMYSPGGRYLAGAWSEWDDPNDDSDEPIVTYDILRDDYHPALRGGIATNTLTVRAEGSTFTLYANGTEVTRFTDDRYDHGAIGVYLQHEGEGNTHAVYDDLVVTQLPERVAPGAAVLSLGTGPATAPAWPRGALRLQDALTEQNPTHPWPQVPGQSFFAQGGLCLRAEADLSLSVTRPILGDDPAEATVPANGVFAVTVVPRQGSIEGSYGLLARFTPTAGTGYAFLLNALGRYRVGKLVGDTFEVLDEGPVGNLIGGDRGNRLQLTLDGSRLRYGINDVVLGSLQDATFTGGTVGLHARDGVTACFRNLEVHDLPAR